MSDIRKEDCKQKTSNYIESKMTQCNLFFDGWSTSEGDHKRCGGWSDVGTHQCGSSAFKSEYLFTQSGHHNDGHSRTRLCYDSADQSYEDKP